MMSAYSFDHFQAPQISIMVSGKKRTNGIYKKGREWLNCCHSSQSQVHLAPWTGHCLLGTLQFTNGTERLQSISIAVTVHDDEFVTQHLQNVTVTLVPNHELAPLCVANSLWYSGKRVPDNLTSLVHLHEAELVLCSKSRYEQDAESS